jgi:hypothetical protein
MAERLRILILALELENFTAGELAAHADASISTVRSLIQRDPEMFAEVDPNDSPDATPRVGRPAKRYVLADPDKVREEVEGIRREIDLPSLRDVGLPVVGDEWQSASDEQALTLSVAESYLRRAVQAQAPAGREALAGMALRNAARALSSQAAPSGQSQHLRADAVRTFAQLLLPTDSALELLTVAVGVLVSAAQSVSTAIMHELLVVLLDASGRLKYAPPIGVVTAVSQSPEEVMLGFEGADWTKTAVANADYALWAPTWASRLVESQLLAGVVVGSVEDEDATIESAAIERIAAWGSPFFVTSSTSPQMRRYAVDRGALFLPPDVHEAVGVIRNFHAAYEYHAPARPRSVRAAAVSRQVVSR